MKKARYIEPLGKEQDPEIIGNKALSLLFLKKNNFAIPLTWVLNSNALEDFRILGNEFLETLKDELKFLPGSVYAVRSSTSVEDSRDLSHAGQFQTFLNVSGRENILQAIREVWDSSQAGNIPAPDSSAAKDKIKCAVILQEMIPAKLSGVSFSKNPVNSNHEIIIEAVEGHGDDLVQKGVNPLRWRIRKNKIAEGIKEDKFLRVITEVGAKTRKIARLYKEQVDVEWAFDGKKLYFLQVRPLTAKGEIPVYSNKMAKEMLPGQVKPLVWSVNIPLVNGTWIDIISKITGQVNVRPEELAKSFYYRTYFNVGALSRLFSEFGISAESLEDLLTGDEKKHPSFRPGFRILRHGFRIIRFIRAIFKFEKFFLREFPEVQTAFRDMERKIQDEFSVGQYHALYEELFILSKRIVYLNIMVPIRMQILNSRLKKKLKKAGVDYELLDFNNDFPELVDISPLPALARIKVMIDELSPDIKARIKSYRDLAAYSETDKIAGEIGSFIHTFGHFSESGNDFSYKKWEEDPELVFDMILNSPSIIKKKDLSGFENITQTTGPSRRLHRMYRKTGKYRVYREKVSSLYTYGYGQFRKLFHRVGEELKQSGILEDKDDIFFLDRQEIDEALGLKDNIDLKDFKTIIAGRKDEMDATKDFTLPTVIFGEKAPVLEIGNQKNFYGVGSSAGIFTGKARIIRKLSDFRQKDKGAVLIIPFSDVSWSPILMQAGAIVSEAGGMLSHCSILARESGIPTLVSVENACAIPDGSFVTVDGSNGILTLYDNGDPNF